MNKYAIIVAGGSGKRMGTKIPKQFLELAQKPILMHTLARFFEASPAINLLVVLPQSQTPEWEKLCKKHNFSIPHQIVVGGKERFFSVKNGLDKITESEAIVAIHDGVRPFVSVCAIRNAFEKTSVLKATTLVVDLKDSIRLVDEKGNRAVDRNTYKLVQTPQTFTNELIQKAYKQPYSDLFTDDASVVEALGEKIHLIEGDYKNIKITSPEDLIIGEAILKNKN